MAEHREKPFLWLLQGQAQGEVTAPAPEDLFILLGAANAVTLFSPVTKGAMRSQLLTGFPARNPNPTPASYKPGDLLCSATSVARKGFRGRFGSKSAQVSLGTDHLRGTPK